jgi:16S rRNA (guanine527-N7)-methyltransferase
LEKKIKVVSEITKKLGLKNVVAEKIRSENVDQQYDFVVSRAVTNMTDFIKIVDGKISSNCKNSLKNGILYLKGGNLENELKDIDNIKVFDISNHFSDVFFETKKIVYLPMTCKGKDNQLAD